MSCTSQGNHNVDLLQFVRQKACFYGLGFIRVFDFVFLFDSAINWSRILQDNASLSEISGWEGNVMALVLVCGLQGLKATGLVKTSTMWRVFGNWKPLSSQLY